MVWLGEKGVIQKAVEPYLLRRMQEREAYLPAGVDGEHC
jgi:hypothetical protein